MLALKGFLGGSSSDALLSLKDVRIRWRSRSLARADRGPW